MFDRGDELVAISPDQYQAMREHIVGVMLAWAPTSARYWREASDEAVALMVEWNHPGGLTAFLAEHPTREDRA